MISGHTANNMMVGLTGTFIGGWIPMAIMSIALGSSTPFSPVEGFPGSTYSLIRLLPAVGQSQA